MYIEKKQQQIFTHITQGQKQAVQKHVVFFIGATVRLQSRDIQVIDSDTHLCTQRFYTEEVKHLQNRKKQLKKRC